MNKIILAGSLIIVVAGGCSNSRKVVKQRVTLDTLSVTAKPFTRLSYQPSATRVWDITNTKLAIKFDLPGKTAQGIEDLTAHPYFYDTDTIALDAKGLEISKVSLGQTALQYQYENDILLVKLGKTYRAQDSITLHIEYTAKPYAVPPGGSAAIREDRGLYFINTDKSIPGKPVQIWTQGETESNSHWFPTIDKPNERFTVDLSMTVPDSFVTLSNGKKVASAKVGNGLRTDRWVTEQPIQTYAVMMAIGKYAIVKDRSWNDKPIEYYVEPEYEPYAKLIFQHTPDMVAFFSKKTGVPYPWNKYSQVIARDYVSGAMENTSASLFGEFVNQNAREIKDHNYEDVVSHELFHQWFGDYVTAESWSNLTLNESFATYGELIWREEQYGKPYADELRWNYLLRYLGQSEDSDPSLVRYYYEEREDMFDRISYQKGGVTLHYLHDLMGDAAFSQAMQIYLSRNALKPAEAHQWRLAVEEATGQDWNWFFNQWYFRGGHPILDVYYNYDDAAQKLTVTTRQSSADSSFTYRLPLNTTLLYGNGERQTVRWDIRRKADTFVYAYRNGKRPVVNPDSDHWLVGQLREKKTQADYLLALRESDDYISRRLALYGAYNNGGRDSATAVIKAAMDDKMASIKELAYGLLLRMPATDKYIEPYKSMVALAAAHDGNNDVRAAALTVIGHWKLKSSVNEVKEALVDSSYMVAGAALSAYHELDSVAAYAAAKNTLASDPRADQETAAWQILAQTAAPADLDFFERNKNTMYGRRRLTMVAYLGSFLNHTTDTTAFSRGVALIDHLYNTESISSYRGAQSNSIEVLAKRIKDGKTTNKAERQAILRKTIAQWQQSEPDDELKERLGKLLKTGF